MKSVTATVLEMDVSTMKATVAVDGEDIVDVSVGRVYNTGEEIVIYNVKDLINAWYLQDEERIDEELIPEPEVIKGTILQGVRIG